MDAKAALEAYQNEVEPLIAKYFKAKHKQAKQISPATRVALERLEEYTLRKAKRIRAALMYYTYRMMGGKKLEDIKQASIFIEILHAYLLIHDDVMDQDSFRRGKPSMHKLYEEDHKRFYDAQDPKHFGESMAINVGDIGCHLALLSLAEANFPPERVVKAMSKLHDQITTVGYGQMLDVLSSVHNEVTEGDVVRVHTYKTATYTYETPMVIGAILAGASDAELKQLSKYAIPAGIAFQIQDDILGLFGDEYKLGKPNISDLREGKHTLLIIKALEKANRQQVRKITRALGNPGVTQKLADEVRQIVKDTGSLDYSKDLAIKYVKRAKRALAEMPNWNGEGRAFLDGIADYMIKREF